MKKRIIWIIYIVIIIFAIIYFWKLSPEKEDIKKEAPFGLYKDMITMIRRDNYIFDYKISTKDMVINYIGQRVEDQEKSEIKFNNEEGSTEKLSNYININFIEPNYIFDLLEDKKYSLNIDENKRTYNYQIEIDNQEIEIIVTTDLSSITYIIIRTNNITYDLKYENIGFTVIN